MIRSSRPRPDGLTSDEEVPCCPQARSWSWRRGRCATSAVGLTLLIVGTVSGVALAEAPQPAGAKPSAIAQMVCHSEAAGDIAELVGETAKVTTPTWKNHLYSCEYRYGKSAYFSLSVKELSNWQQTYTYFDDLAASLKKVASVRDLGQGAFRTRDGSVVVRKDWKVLVVDVSALPSSFGEPSFSSGEIALDVAGAILGCWDGD